MKTTKKRIRKARCKYVLAILNCNIEKFKLLREEIYPPVGDFDEFMTYAVCFSKNLLFKEIMIPINCVVFLKD